MGDYSGLREAVGKAVRRVLNKSRFKKIEDWTRMLEMRTEAGGQTWTMYL